MTNVMLAVLLALQAGGADASNSSAAWGTFIWMGVIALVFICLAAIGIYALGERSSRLKRRT